MKCKYLKHILLFLFLFIGYTLSAQKDNYYVEFMNLSSDELLKMSEEYEDKENMDSALVLYSIVASRADNTDDKEEIKRSCKAYIGKSMIYLSYFYDYNKAYENLLSAMELKNEAKIEYSPVDNTAAIFYHVIAVTCRDWDKERIAMEYSRNAYHSASRDKKRESMDVIVTNMIVMSCNLNETKLIDDVWKTYADDENTSFYYRFNHIFYNYLKCLIKKNYVAAIVQAEQMLKLSKDTSHRRYVIISYNSLIEANDKKGDYKTALIYIEKEEKFIEKLNMRDISMEILNKKHSIYSKLGEKTLADDYARMYYQKKDSLLNLTQMTNICRTLYNGESRKMERIIEKVSIENKIYNKVMIIILGLVVVLVIMLVMLYVKIKQLRKSNITIYENNEENFKQEDKERQKLKDEVLKFNNTVGVPESPTINKDSDSEKNTVIADEMSSADDEKYKKNSMSDEEKKKLLDKILTVMENVDEICSESFSGARLAELTGYKYNYVSLVINEYYGCNFNSLLNRFRVKEACRRLSDEKNYGNYTIDTISNSIGFKSRTTLTTSFKKIIGLTPSQYRSIAKEKRNS